jgi:hypothetical protein
LVFGMESNSPQSSGFEMVSWCLLISYAVKGRKTYHRDTEARRRALKRRKRIIIATLL